MTRVHLPAAVLVCLALALGLSAVYADQHEQKDKPHAGAAHEGAPREGAVHESLHDMVMLVPDQVQWKPGPPSLPAGAHMAVLEGDPGKPGLFTMRLKLPANYRIPAHTHPRVERVTVLSGAFRLGAGRSFDDAKLKDYPPGSYVAMPPGMEHFAAAGAEETVVQLNAVGPWEIHYLNPADDPRGAKK